MDAENGRLEILKEVLCDPDLTLEAKRYRPEVITLCSRGENGNLVVDYLVQHCSIMAQDLNNCCEKEGETINRKSN